MGDKVTVTKKQKRKTIFDYDHDKEIHIQNEKTWSDRMIERKKKQFASERGLNCEICWSSNRAIYLTEFDNDYTAVCVECKDSIDSKNMLNKYEIDIVELDRLNKWVEEVLNTSSSSNDNNHEDNNTTHLS